MTRAATLRAARSMLYVLLGAAVACRDVPNGTPASQAPTEVVAVPVTCAVDPAAGAGQCRVGAAAHASTRDEAVRGAAAALRAMPAVESSPGGMLDAVLGSTAVGLTVFEVQQLAGGVVSFQLAVRNLLDQPLGVDAAGTVPLDGVRVFVENGPTAAPAGDAVLVNATGTGTGSAPGQSYFQYGAVMQAGDEITRLWRVALSGGATRFTFRVLVVTEVPVVSRIASGTGPFADVVRGGDVTCAVTRAGQQAVGGGGGVFCWGSSTSGSTGRPANPTPVGLGLRTPVEMPGDVQAATLPRAFNTVPAFLCALRLDGLASCRGILDVTLGVSQPFELDAPDDRPVVLTGQSLVSLVASEFAVCGLDASGAAWCRGGNAAGELGRSAATNPNQLYPWGPVDGNHRYTHLTAGSDFFCGVTTSSVTLCWGANQDGQMGRGTRTMSQPTPRPVLGGRTFVQVSAGGSHACGREANGVVSCWGRDDFLQNGNGAPRGFVPDTLPEPVIGGHVFASIEAGPRGACGILATGAMRCWGDNSFAQLGADLSTWGSDSTPRLIPGGHTWAQVSIGDGHICGRTTAGVVRCWGDDNLGQLGRGEPSLLAADLDSLSQPIAAGAGGFVGVASGGSTSCAWRADGSLVCWGSNAVFGARSLLTARRSPDHVVPTGVLTTRRFAALAASPTLSCGVAAGTGELWCWGRPSMLSAGATTETPVQVLAGQTVRTIAVGRGHACATTTAGQGWCWGVNTSGQLGDGTRFNRTTPVLVQGGHTWRSISVGETHTCGVIQTTNAVRCWGANTRGQVGGGTFQPDRDSLPRLVAGSYAADTVVLGTDHSCGLSLAPADSGAVRCWGSNFSGELGFKRDPLTSSYPSPQPVIQGLRFDMLSAGGAATCGRTLAGSVMCWGLVYRGNGDFQPLQENGPVLALGGMTVRRFSIGAPAAAVASGCAVLLDGDLQCWGNFAGRRTQVPSPARPLFPSP